MLRAYYRILFGGVWRCRRCNYPLPLRPNIDGKCIHCGQTWKFKFMKKNKKGGK